MESEGKSLDINIDVKLFSGTVQVKNVLCSKEAMLYSCWRHSCHVCTYCTLPSTLTETWASILIWESSARCIVAFDGKFGFLYLLAMLMSRQEVTQYSGENSVLKEGAPLMSWHGSWAGSSRGRNALKALHCLLSGVTLLVVFVHKFSGVWLN